MTDQPVVPPPTHADLESLAAEAFIYGSPLVFDLQQVARSSHEGMGSLAPVPFVIQRDEPTTAERRANWLPTPAGTFRPILRMYEPVAAVFDGSYVLPAITRVA